MIGSGMFTQESHALLDEIFDSPHDNAALLDNNGCVLWANLGGQRLLGIESLDDLRGTPWISGWFEHFHASILNALEDARSGRVGQFSAQRLRCANPALHLSVKVMHFRLGEGIVDGLLAIAHEVASVEGSAGPEDPVEQKSQTRLLSNADSEFVIGQKQALELAATDAPISDVLHKLITIAELHSQGEMLASILLMDADGEHLRLGAAPSFPAPYNEAVDGMGIGPQAGSCGTAAYLKSSVFVKDIQTDSLWADFREIAVSHGLRACWSVPILSTHGNVLGTLAYYFREPREPSAAEADSMPILVHTAALLLERHREAGKRRAVEHALRRSEAKLERLIDSNIIGVVSYRFEDKDVVDARITEANDAFLNMLGYSRDELDQGVLTWIKITPSEWLETDRRARKRLRSVGVIDTYQKEFFRKDGSRAVVLVGAANLENSKHEGIAYVLDISEIRQSAQALKESEAKFRTIANAMPQMVWSTLPDGYHDYYNDQWYRFTGVIPGSTDGAAWNGLFHPDDQKRAREVWSRSLVTGEPYEIEYRLRHHSGQFRWTLGRALPVRDDAGRIIRWMGTCTDIHEQRMTQESLHDSHRRKDEFLAMLAHELRNPLAPICAAAELLRIDSTDKGLIRSVSEVIARQAGHMTGLIEDLLDVSRVTRGQIDLVKTNLNVRALVEAAVEQVRTSMEEHRHHLEVVLPPESVSIPGDEKRLVQVFANLLGNAVKYTPNGGHIHLHARVSDGMLLISVRDDGIGMTPELTEQAFELFVQGERTSDRSQGGLGIGLALVKSLVGLHDGFVRALSDGLGRGSEFLVGLPLTGGTEALMPGAVPAEQNRVAKGLRILLVDDNVDAADMLGLLLQSVGHTLHVEQHPVRALETAAVFKPDVCLLDIGLPEMNGNELARRLLDVPILSRCLLIAVTGYGQPHDLETAYASGFTHHFVKPVDIPRLLTILDEHRRRV